MKNLYFIKIFLCLLFAALLFFSKNLSAQNTAPIQEEKLIIRKTNTDGFNEQELREMMRSDGLTDPVIDILIEKRRELHKRGQNPSWTSVKKYHPTPVPNAVCSDMGVENGWGQWYGDVGTANSGSQTWTPPATNPPPAPNFAINTGGNIPCTPGPTPPPAPNNGPIPVVSPGFGNASLQLGVNQTAGCVAEQATYQLTVGPGDTNFIYSYAILLQDAGHSVSQQPFVELCIYDSAGNPVPCGCFRYTGGPNIPGFYQSSCLPAYYKPWTIVGVNLSNYVGQTLNVVITNVDCAQCGHYAQSYWDFTCKPFSSSAAASFCLGQSTSICAPSDPAINYSYQWYQNGLPYTGPPNATAPCITPTPNVGDTFSVYVMQPSGCNFYMTYVPTPMTVTPNFTYVVQCGGTVTFTDQSTASNGSPITQWQWSFPGGTPATSTVQNPVVTYPAGSYTATLIVTSQNGCKDTIALPVNVTGLPQAAFNVTTVCEGNPTVFTDASIPAAGDPIVSWSWNFAGGNPATSTSQNPSVTYPPGNYTATLTVTSQAGCTSTATMPVVVNPKPVANLDGNNVCFNNATTFTDLSIGNNTITSWNWNFGNNNTSTAQNPSHTYSSPGTYTVTLIVTNNYGCMDTNTTTVVVNPLPIANFSSTTVCFGNPTCFTDLSSITTGNITTWSWNFGDPNSGPQNISNQQNPCHTFTAPGNYQVTLTVTSDSLCQSTTILPVTFYPPPVANFNSSPVCLGNPTQFTDVSTFSGNDPVTAWDWNFGDGSPNGNVQNPSHVYSTPGNYTVTLIVTTQQGCKDTISNPIIVYANPVAAFSAPDSGCSPVCQTFTDLSTSQSGTISTWLWSFPGGSPSLSTSTSPTVCWNVPGSYGVQLIVTTQYGCKDTLAVTNYINVFGWPTADFCVTPTENSVNSPNFAFCDLWSSDVVSWSWDFGDGSAPDNTNTDPTHSYSATVTNNDFYAFNVCLFVETIHGCTDTICKTVEVIPEFSFYIPNCFTPNGDSINDVFFGKSRGVKEYSIWVFDRWGNLIWDCHYEGKNTQWDNSGQDGMSSACKWDGIVEGGGSGQIVQEDVYVWKVLLTDIFDKKHTYIGHVSVVK